MYRYKETIKEIKYKGYTIKIDKWYVPDIHCWAIIIPEGETELTFHIGLMDDTKRKLIKQAKRFIREGKAAKSYYEKKEETK